MARMGKDDWLLLGLNALAESGEAALRIDAITVRAGKTRGSFYHHFATHDAFIDGMMKLWRDQNTTALIEAAAAEETMQIAAATLSRMASVLDHKREQAIRRLSASNETARAAVAKVDAERLAFLRTLQADPESDAAADYALIEYAVFIGVQALLPDATTDRLLAISALTSDMIATHWNE